MNKHQLEKLKDYLAKAMAELLELNKVIEKLEKDNQLTVMKLKKQNYENSQTSQ